MRLGHLIFTAFILSGAGAAQADQFTINGTNTITFSLSASPIPVSSTHDEGVIVNNVDVTFNGVQRNEDILFFEDGIIIGDNPFITKDGIFYSFSADNQIANDFTVIPGGFLGYESALIYSGGESTPTFLPGTYELQDQNGNGDISLTIAADTVTAAPEPSSIALLGTGLLALAGIAGRRRVSL